MALPSFTEARIKRTPVKYKQGYIIATGTPFNPNYNQLQLK
jgi:hypothetical protein